MSSLPIGLHECYVDADYLADIAKAAGQPYALALLEVAGLVRGVGNNTHEMHPALGRYLRAQAARQTAERAGEPAWERGFRAVMAALADHLAPLQRHEQRPVFELFGSSFEPALALSQARRRSTASACVLPPRRMAQPTG
jgi:hypothetical protein